MRYTHPMYRRSFLAGLCALVAGNSALAAGKPVARPLLASPKRIVFVYVPDGVTPQIWHPSGNESTFTLPEMSKALAAIQGDCVFLKGLDMYAGGATHEGGVRKVLTGNAPRSLDIFLGEFLGTNTMHRSIQLGVATSFQNGSGYVSAIGTDQFVEPEDNPLAAFDRMFGSINNSDPNLALKRARRKSVIDISLAELQGLQNKLGNAEKNKLAEHVSSIRELEKRLVGGQAGTCKTVEFNKQGFKHTVPPYYPLDYHEEKNLDLMADLQTDLVRLALSCDVTRVVTLQLSHPVSPTRVPGSTSGHHDASHQGGAVYVKSRDWFNQRFVKLVQALKGVTETDGTLLDNTVIFLCSELGDGSLHDHKNMPFVLAGGKNLGFRPGRFLDYSAKNAGQNEPHTKLLVSLANSVGSTIDSYGYTGHGKGPLTALTG